METGFTFRRDVRVEDMENVRRIVDSSGYFFDHEIDVAVELVEEYLAKGEASGYRFIFAERDGEVLGYTCFGLTPCTVHSYDLYWIAVMESCRGSGLGKLLLLESEKDIHSAGGRRVYIETSSREQYRSTQGFYLRCGYRQEAHLEDFYAPADGKLIYVKTL